MYQWKPNKNYYPNYLASKHWISLKKKYLDKRPHARCFICGIKRNLLLHHISYNNKGDEKMYRDLFVVCHTCHNPTHNLFGFIKLPLKRTFLLPNLLLAKIWYMITFWFIGDI